MKQGSIELFSDYFAQSINLLTQIDARVKLVFTLSTLVMVISGNSISPMLLIAGLCICVLLLIRIPMGMILSRLAAPLVMVAILIILQGLLYGKTPLYSFSYGGFTLSVYEEGISRGIMIAGRVMAGTSLMLFLSMTTPVNKLLGALSYFKVPSGWLEIVAFSYRYIFVFVEEAQSIMDSQRLRLGYSKASIGLRSWGTLMGALFTRVYDQANATHAAMVLRGYNGVLYFKKPGSLAKRDIGASLLMAAVFLLLLLFTFYRG